MTINIIQNNFGSESFALRCLNSAERVIISGSFGIDAGSAAYQQAERLELVSDTAFLVTESRVSSAYLVSELDGECYGTIVRAHIQDGNKLILEKLPYYDERGSVRIILASMFVSGESDEVMAAVASSKLRFVASGPQGSLVLDTTTMCHFEEGWGCISGKFSTFNYSRGCDMLFNVNGLPSGADFEVPLFFHRYYTPSAPGTKCFIAHFSGGQMTFTGDSGTGMNYNGATFISAFYAE